MEGFHGVTVAVTFFAPCNLTLGTPAMNPETDQPAASATDLAHAWEGVGELRRRAHQLKLVAKLFKSCSGSCQEQQCNDL